MSSADTIPSAESIRFNNIYGIFVLSPDDVQFRTGTTSGTACVVSDPERRGLLGSVIERLLLPEAVQRRPWNQAEVELLEEVLPQLRQNGIIEVDGQQQGQNTGFGSVPVLRKTAGDARITIVGHGVLGEAVSGLLSEMPCRSIAVVQSSSVSAAHDAKRFRSARQVVVPEGEAKDLEGPRARPRDAAQWIEAIRDSDWVIAAQDCFEPEELAALNTAALQLSLPWSLVCFDGYEGWVGPTFMPRQTACFSCFRRRLLAGAAEPNHVFMDPGIKVHRVPSPWSIGPEARAWVSLITSMFAMELIAAMQGRSFTLSQMLIVHRLNLTFQRESVLRLPRCSDCSPQRSAPTVNVFSHVLSSRRMSA